MSGFTLILCAHADRAGEWMHWKRAGEMCPADFPSLGEAIAAYYASGQADIDRGGDHIERNRP